MQFADITNDVAFRKVFGNENRKESLISFLNSILEFDNQQKIVSVNILNPYQLPKLRSGKVTIVDIKATDQSGKQYIIEMQVAEVDGFDKRVLYYFSKSYSEQIKRSDFYLKLNPVIFIGVLDFKFTKNSNYFSRSQVRDVETGERTIHDIEFNFIELPKFNKELHELHTLAEKWIYFIKNAEDLEVIPENVDDEGLKSAYEEANKHTWTKEELDAYDYAHMREQDERGRLELALRRGHEEGMKEGHEKGMKEGMKEGIRKGIENSKFEIVKNAINKGFDDDTIAELTGLTMKQIVEMRKKYKK
jgi:predicted transposase/invertase (TIGR01784 family)